MSTLPLMAIPDYKQYVPFLKGKQGELDALSTVNRGGREQLTPLVEIGPIEIDPKTGANTKSLDETLEGLAAKIAKAWGSLDFCFVDLPEFDPDARLESGQHPVARFFEDAKAVDLAAVPVAGLDRDKPHLDAVAEARSWRGTGLAIRVRRRELQTPTALAGGLTRLAGIVGVDFEEADLLLDFGHILKSETTAIEAMAEAAILALPEVDSWRSLTVSSGAFPETVSPDVKPGETGVLERRDFALWRALTAGKALPRLPAFGDYGVASPEWLQGFDPEIMAPAAKIVYAREKDWLVVRGRSLKKHGFGQYRALAHQVIRSGSFQGSEHCWGDSYIAKCANGRVGTGSLKTWVSVATSHHLGVTTRQLASLP
jgi:hypothetical protein